MSITVYEAFGSPSLPQQPDHFWESIYDPHLRLCLKSEVDGVQAAVIALMTPRLFLEQFLQELSYSADEFYEVGALYVMPAYRHLGLASLLVGEAESILASQSLNPVCCIMEGNEPSLRLFTGLDYSYRGAFTGVDGKNLVFTHMS